MTDMLKTIYPTKTPFCGRGVQLKSLTLFNAKFIYVFSDIYYKLQKAAKRSKMMEARERRKTLKKEKKEKKKKVKEEQKRLLAENP